MLNKLKKKTEKLDDYSLQIHLSKKKKMVIQNRYRILGHLNDSFLGILYLIGSILFLMDAERVIAVTFFLAGSILMILRAVIHIARDIHLKRFTNEDFK
ncbi:YrhK family protein [Bacillus sp. AK031]